MVDPNRLIKPKDGFRIAFPGLGFREVYSFHTSGEPVLMTDPIYLADVYKSEEMIAAFLRSHGVFIMDFGGDVSGPVWWKHPYVLVPISIHLSEEDLMLPEGATLLADEIGTDSGSFVFLSLAEHLPSLLRSKVEEVLARGRGVALSLPAGVWHVLYEQWDAPEIRLEALYRNIVLKWTLPCGTV